MIGTLNDLGEIARLEGNLDEAIRRYTEAIDLGHELGIELVMPMQNLAFTLLQLGDYAQVETLFRHTLSVNHAVMEKAFLGFDFEGFASLAAARGRPERAARLFGASERLRESLGAAGKKFHGPADVAEYERNISLARAQLDKEMFDAAWAEGRTLTLEHAVALALGDG